MLDISKVDGDVSFATIDDCSTDYRCDWKWWIDISIVDSITKIVLFLLLQILNYTIAGLINSEILSQSFSFVSLVNWRRSNRINHWKGQRRWWDFEKFRISKKSFFIHSRNLCSFVFFLKIIIYERWYMKYTGYGELHLYRECHKYHWSEATAMLHSLVSHPSI